MRGRSGLALSSFGQDPTAPHCLPTLLAQWVLCIPSRSRNVLPRVAISKPRIGSIVTPSESGMPLSPPSASAREPIRSSSDEAAPSPGPPVQSVERASAASAIHDESVDHEQDD